MEIIMHAEGKNYKKLQGKLLKDEVVNRASVVFKEASQYGLGSGYLIIVRGDEERCTRALEVAAGKADGEQDAGEQLAEEITGEQKEEISKKIKEGENKAIEGFGSIFG
jgi:hypothetical protein